nr:uncharacterized protein LOC105880150 isoform X3 [Microcebus murinus]
MLVLLYTKLLPSSAGEVRDGWVGVEEPQGGLADACTSVLAALGSRNPGMIIDMLLYESEDNTLPLRSLLVAVGDLSLRSVLSGLATSAQDLLDMASPEDPVMDKTSDQVAIRAHFTLLLFSNHKPLVAEKALETTAHLFLLLRPPYSRGR